MYWKVESMDRMFLYVNLPAFRSLMQWNGKMYTRLSREPGNKSDMRGVGRETACGACKNFSRFDPIFYVSFSWLFIWRVLKVLGERVPRYYGRRRGLSTPWLVCSPGVWWFNGTVEREMGAFPAGPQLSAVVLCRGGGKELSGNSSKRDSSCNRLWRL